MPLQAFSEFEETKLLWKNWFMVSGSPSNFGCTLEVAQHERNVRVSPSAALASRVLSKLPSGPITRWALANYEPIVK